MIRQFHILLLALLFSGSLQAQDDKQNILFIAVDDLKPLLSNYGHDQMHTPNFDRLAAMGVTFTNAHVQQAVCGPSRASIITGAYPDKTRVFDLHTNFRESNPDLISMPEHLINNGYETTAVGKILHKSSTSPGHDGESWSIPHILPENFDPTFGDPAYGTYHHPDTKAKIAAIEKELDPKGKKNNLRGKVFKKIRPATEMMDVSDESYQDGIYAVEAIKRMRSMAKGDRPFFLGLGFQKPHLPFVAPKKYWDLYKREDIKLDPLQEKGEGIPEIAYHNYGELRAYSDIPSDMDLGDILDEEKQRELIHGYMACISYIDALLGKVLDEYEALGLDKNTLIVLWGDHGFHLGDHTIWCKHSNFEQATRIPLMFAGPGVEKGIKSHHPVELLDVFPTLFDLANVPASAQTEGISLVPLMDGKEGTNVSKDFAISQYSRQKDAKGYSIRTDRYRYTEWHVNHYNSHMPYDEANIKAIELYDYQEDPLESRNLIKDEDYASVKEAMKAKLRTYLASKENPESLSAKEPVVKESHNKKEEVGKSKKEAKKVKKTMNDGGQKTKSKSVSTENSYAIDDDSWKDQQAKPWKEMTKEERVAARKANKKAMKKAEKKASKNSGKKSEKATEQAYDTNAPTDAKPAAEALSVIRKKSKTAQPNIVFIHADDLGYHDLSSTGSEIYNTPNIDRLAKESVSFTNAYSSYPRCTPSRYGMITATYPVNEDHGNLSKIPSESNFVHQFEASEYQTSYVGKWHLGGGDSAPKGIGFDHSVAAGTAGGTGTHFYPFNTKKHSNDPDKTIEDVTQIGKEGEYLADLLTDQSMAFINNAENGKPFFAMLAHYAVHTPIEAKEEDRKRNQKQIDAYDFGDTPEYIKEGEGRRKMRQDDADYAGMVENLDYNVGRILDMLDKMGIADNTIVVFSSDHGGLSNDGNKRQRHLATTNLPLKAGKGHLYEGGIRVPLFIRWPEQLKPRVDSKSIVVGMDIMPTLLDLAIDKELADVDGVSFEKVLAKNDCWDERAVFWHSNKARPHSTGDIPCTAMRSGKWKLLHFFEADYYELYDLSKDISEENNLIEKEAKVVEKLKAELDTWKKENLVPSKLNRK